MANPDRDFSNFDATRIEGGIAATRPPSSVSGIRSSAPAFPPGTVLADRYEIIALLGEGGMGAVYKAQDRETERLVALKTIRPEMAGSTDMLTRFKQELILARQITHRNVIRIYDIGEAAGTKFITMEFVEGDDLRSLLRDKGRFVPDEAVDVMQQVCRALEAAHAEGVIHRDLKPGNIMRDRQGRIVVMDFGLARTLESGLTQTGALVGTMEYMSPEQALGNEIDARSDLFAIGLIFYELLTGNIPYKAETAIASLLKRAQERAIPAREVDASVPQALSDIVGRCLERDRNQRYQSATEILADLENFRGGSVVGASRATGVSGARVLEVPAPPRPKWLYYGVGIAVLVTLLSLAIGLRHRIFAPAPPAASAKPELSLAILPFRNASGDPKLDWLGSSLAEMLSTDVGQSSQLRSVSSDRLHQVMADLRITADTSVDATTMRQIAEFTSADTLVLGQYVRFGDQIRIDAILQDLKNNRRIPLKIEGVAERDIPGAVDRLAEAVRNSLALSPETVKQLAAQSFKPNSSSPEALREYNEGLNLIRQGRDLNAVQVLEAAVKDDPQFALAYSKLAHVYDTLGNGDQAEQASHRAVELSYNLPEQEKFRIQAEHARITKDYTKAIAAYEQVAKAVPNDTDVQYTLGDLYENASKYDQARDHYNKVVESDPKSINGLLALGRVDLLQRNPQASLEDLNRALTVATQLDNSEQKAKVLLIMGYAYRGLAKPQDELRYFQESLAIRRKLGDKRGIADALHAIAIAQSELGKPQAALAGFRDALKLWRETGDKAGTGQTLLDMGLSYNMTGNFDDALNTLKEALQIERSVNNKNYEATALNGIGAAYFDKGEYEDARTYYQQALELREKLNVPTDVADTIHNLAETATYMGDYEGALTSYLRALEIRRAAGDKAGAGMDAYAMATLFQYEGRFGAAVHAMEDALKAIREAGENGYWMAEILTGYGAALVQIGRGEEGRKYLEQGLSVARRINNDQIIAENVNAQGDAAFLEGNYKGAQKLYEQAMPLATKAKDAHLTLVTKFNLAKVAVKQGSGQPAIAALRTVMQQADRTGLAYLSAQSAICLSEALLNVKQYSESQQQLQRTLAKSEKLGLRTGPVVIHYLLAKLARATGNTVESERQAREARRLLDEIRKDSGDSVVKRSDLGPVLQPI